jgi:hypothetical protein
MVNAVDGARMVCVRAPGARSLDLPPATCKLQAPVTVVVTGGAGQIAYSLLPSLVSGSVFGPDQPVILHLLDIEPAQVALGGVKMEMEDLAYPLYAGAVCTGDPAVAFKGSRQRQAGARQSRYCWIPP